MTCVLSIFQRPLQHASIVWNPHPFCGLWWWQFDSYPPFKIITLIQAQGFLPLGYLFFKPKWRYLIGPAWDRHCKKTSPALFGAHALHICQLCHEFFIQIAPLWLTITADPCRWSTAIVEILISNTARLCAIHISLQFRFDWSFPQITTVKVGYNIISEKRTTLEGISYLVADSLIMLYTKVILWWYDTCIYNLYFITILV
jgi:hypothetical protein